MKITEKDIAMLTELRSVGKEAFSAKVYELACRVVVLAGEIKESFCQKTLHCFQEVDNEYEQKLAKETYDDGVANLKLVPIDWLMVMDVDTGSDSVYPVMLYAQKDDPYRPGEKCAPMCRISFPVWWKIHNRLNPEEKHVFELLRFNARIRADIFYYRYAAQTITGLGLDLADPKVW